MSELNSSNNWIYNCGKEDFDYRAVWGNGGDLTIQRENLRSIAYFVRGYTAVNGWGSDQQKTQTLPNPTSQPHTFTGVLSLIAFKPTDMGNCLAISFRRVI